MRVVTDAPRLEADTVQHGEGQMTCERVGRASSSHSAVPRVMGDQSQLDAQERRGSGHQEHQGYGRVGPCKGERDYERRREQKCATRVAGGVAIEQARPSGPGPEFGD